jgi:hypothetical protein
MNRVGRVACMAVALLAGCGGTASLSSAARSTLDGRVSAVKTAVANDDVTGATAALAALRTAVADLEAQHQLSAAKAASILSAAVQVEAQLPTLPTTTTTLVVGPDTSLPPPPGDHHHKDQGGGGGGGEG